MEQCKKVVTKLKEEKQLGQEWSIRLKKSSSKIALAIINDLNECAVTTLDIRYTPLTSSFMSTLSDILSKNKTLKRLVFFDSPFPGGDMKQLTRAISTNNTLEELVLENVPVTDEDTTYLSDMLETNQTLKLLRLIACNITNNGIHNIHEGLVKNKAITRLFFSNNPQITSASTNVIVDLMRNTKSLKELHLAATSLEEKDIETICNALVKIDTMEILMLSKKHQEHCQTLDCYDDIKSKLHFW